MKKKAIAREIEEDKDRVKAFLVSEAEKFEGDPVIHEPLIAEHLFLVYRIVREHGLDTEKINTLVKELYDAYY
jgi:hypothetical protein